MKQKNRKKLLVLGIIPFESGTANSQNPEGIILIGSQCVTKHT